MTSSTKINSISSTTSIESSNSYPNVWEVILTDIEAPIRHNSGTDVSIDKRNIDTPQRNPSFPPNQSMETKSSGSILSLAVDSWIQRAPITPVSPESDYYPPGNQLYEQNTSSEMSSSTLSQAEGDTFRMTLNSNSSQNRSRTSNESKLSLMTTNSLFSANSSLCSTKTHGTENSFFPKNLETSLNQNIQDDLDLLLNGSTFKTVDEQKSEIKAKTHTKVDSNSLPIHFSPKMTQTNPVHTPPQRSERHSALSREMPDTPPPGFLGSGSSALFGIGTTPCTPQHVNSPMNLDVLKSPNSDSPPYGILSCTSEIGLESEINGYSNNVLSPEDNISDGNFHHSIPINPSDSLSSLASLASNASSLSLSKYIHHSPIAPQHSTKKRNFYNNISKSRNYLHSPKVPSSPLIALLPPSTEELPIISNAELEDYSDSPPKRYQSKTSSSKSKNSPQNEYSYNGNDSPNFSTSPEISGSLGRQSPSVEGDEVEMGDSIISEDIQTVNPSRRNSFSHSLITSPESTKNQSLANMHRLPSTSLSQGNTSILINAALPPPFQDPSQLRTVYNDKVHMPNSFLIQPFQIPINPLAPKFKTFNPNRLVPSSQNDRSPRKSGSHNQYRRRSFSLGDRDRSLVFNDPLDRDGSHINSISHSSSRKGSRPNSAEHRFSSPLKRATSPRIFQRRSSLGSATLGTPGTPGSGTNVSKIIQPVPFKPSRITIGKSQEKIVNKRRRSISGRSGAYSPSLRGPLSYTHKKKSPTIPKKKLKSKKPSLAIISESPTPNTRLVFSDSPSFLQNITPSPNNQKRDQTPKMILSPDSEDVIPISQDFTQNN